MLQQHSAPANNDRYRNHHALSISLPLPQHIAEFLQRAPVKLRLLPQIRRQEPIRVPHRHERSLERILERLCRAGGGSVDVLHARELEETFDGWGSDEAGSTRCGDELCEVSSLAICPLNKQRRSSWKNHSLGR